MTIVQLVQQWRDKDYPYYLGIEIYRTLGGARPVSYYERYLDAPYIPDTVKDELESSLLPSIRGANLEQIAVRQSPVKLPSPSASIGVVEFPKVADYASNVAQNANKVALDSNPEPQSVLLLRESAKPLLKQYSHLKANLYSAETDVDRYQIATEIMTLLPQIDNIYAQVKDYHSEGTLPPSAKEKTVQDTVAKFQRILSLKPRISRLKGLVKKTTDPQELAKYQRELTAKEAELITIEEELGL